MFCCTTHHCSIKGRSDICPQVGDCVPNRSDVKFFVLKDIAGIRAQVFSNEPFGRFYMLCVFTEVLPLFLLNDKLPVFFKQLFLRKCSFCIFQEWRHIFQILRIVTGSALFCIVLQVIPQLFFVLFQFLGNLPFVFFPLFLFILDFYFRPADNLFQKHLRLKTLVIRCILPRKGFYFCFNRKQSAVRID